MEDAWEMVMATPWQQHGASSFCIKLLAAEIDPEAKARVSGSERETGRARFFL